MKLHNKESVAITTISNTFIDEYMPDANGDYVKVYLYLLRCMQSGHTELSIGSISDLFDYTEGDVLRAMRYWEKAGLLAVARDANGEITDLALQTPKKRNQSPVQPADGQPVSIPKSAAPIQTPPPVPPAEQYAHKDYSIDELSRLKQDANFDSVLKVVQGYLGHPLNHRDLQTATFIFDELHFSMELIYHLYEYCIVTRDKRRPEYIEQVAISWAKAGVQTPEEADNVSVAYNADYTAVCKAFGLHRMPGQIEREYIDHWVKDLGFDTVMLKEACNRTLLKTNKPEFKYANSILESWYKAGVHTPADIEKQDTIHKTQKENTSVKPASTNKFNQFSQRNYSKEQYSSMEKRLIEQSRLS